MINDVTRERTEELINRYQEGILKSADALRQGLIDKEKARNEEIYKKCVENGYNEMNEVHYLYAAKDGGVPTEINSIVEKAKKNLESLKSNYDIKGEERKEAYERIRRELYDGYRTYQMKLDNEIQLRESSLKKTYQEYLSYNKDEIIREQEMIKRRYEIKDENELITEALQFEDNPYSKSDFEIDELLIQLKKVNKNYFKKVKEIANGVDYQKNPQYFFNHPDRDTLFTLKQDRNAFNDGEIVVRVYGAPGNRSKVSMNIFSLVNFKGK